MQQDKKVLSGHLPAKAQTYMALTNLDPSSAPAPAPGFSVTRPQWPARILVLDDQFEIRSMLEEVLLTDGHQVSLAADLAEARALILKESFDSVIIDIYLGAGECGLDFIPDLAQHQPHTPSIVISGMAQMDDVMRALKAGAYDMLCKPFNILDVLRVVGRAVEKKRMAEENERMAQALKAERDLLEDRVNEATHDLQEKVESLRLLNEQLATIFELSQAPLADNSSEAVLRRIFGLLRRVIDFKAGFCVVYDIKAHGLNLTYAEGDEIGDYASTMAAVIRDHINPLVELAESGEHLPVESVQRAIIGYCPPEWSLNDLMLVPLHVHQALLGVVGLIRHSGSSLMTRAEQRITGLAISHFLAAFEQRSFIARTGQLAGLGELISEIAHDLRHPMTALRGAAGLLNEGWRDDQKRHRCLDELFGNLSRMESLVSELVNFYNPKEMNMVPIDLHALLTQALKITHSLLEQKDIQVDCHFDGESLMILGLSRNLMEAIINLISNACQAMEPQGRLTVETHTMLDETQRKMLLHTGRHPAGFICLMIGDNGCGIPEENMEKVFHRFFTTRPEGHGLGLSAVMRIVKKNLGHIALESKPGEGTRFYIYLPKA